MSNYFSWNTRTISDFSDEYINAMYNRGFVFTRKEKWVMDQTRSIRIDLKKFELSSENNRILNKTKEIKFTAVPLPTNHYTWEIGKIGKDFYETKFGIGTFSANKIKELCTTSHNFNTLFVYSDNSTIGYCIARKTNEIIHYSYPFYDLNYKNKNIGMGMMVRAVALAKEEKKKYIYLGSFQRPTDTYKLQFKGLEWFDGKNWQTNLDDLKKIL